MSLLQTSSTPELVVFSPRRQVHAFQTFARLVSEQLSQPLPLELSRLDEAVQVIAEVGGSGKSSNWYRHLQARSTRLQVRDLLRKNPRLRMKLLAEAQRTPAAAAAVEAFRHFEIGVSVSPQNLSPATLSAALSATEGLKIGSALTTVLADPSSATSRDHPLVKQASSIATAKEDQALRQLGVHLVSDIDHTLAAVQQNRALRKVLSAVLLEEPLVAAGVREQISRTGAPPELRELTNVLALTTEPRTGHYVPAPANDIGLGDFALSR